jgi:hypothetical protein
METKYAWYCRNVSGDIPLTFNGIIIDSFRKLNLSDSRCLNNKAAVYFTHHHFHARPAAIVTPT